MKQHCWQLGIECWEFVTLDGDLGQIVVLGIWYTGGKSGVECWEFGTVNGYLRKRVGNLG